jgi:hypothetical protein
VANSGSNNVSKLRASDGKLLDIWDVAGRYPSGICFDGVNIWTANTSSGSLTEFEASSGVMLHIYLIDDISYPTGVCFDGANIWVANGGGSSVTELKASDETAR